MSHRSARLTEPLRNIQALERFELHALARRKWASRAFSELRTIVPTQAT
jgi:hypothetical protein